MNPHFLAIAFARNSNFDIPSLKKQYNNGTSSENIDFGYQFAIKYANEVVRISELSDAPLITYKKQVEKFIEYTKIFIGTEFFSGVQRLKHNLLNSPQFSPKGKILKEIIDNNNTFFLDDFKRKNISLIFNDVKKQKKELIKKLNNKEDIIQWLAINTPDKNYKYNINDDLSVDVVGNIEVHKRQIPFQFGTIKGDFRRVNTDTLKGCPIYVTGNFDCSGCFELTSLKYAPKAIGGDFNFSNNKIMHLDNMPSVEGWVIAQYNHLQSFEFKASIGGFNFRASEPVKIPALADFYNDDYFINISGQALLAFKLEKALSNKNKVKSIKI